MIPFYFLNFIKPFVSIGRLTLPTYGIMMVLAFLVAGTVFYLLAPRVGLPRPDAFNAVALIFVGGLVGAKLFYLLSLIPYWRVLFTHGWQAVLAEIVSGGMVFYGGLIGGLIVLLIYLKKFKLPLAGSFDIAAIALALGHAIGRLGCFSVGCCYGVPSRHGILMPHSIIAPNDIRLVPTQLIESAFLLLLALVLYLLLRKSPRPGVVMKTYLVAYAVFRFVLEFWRGDRVRGFIGPFSVSQWISLLLLAALLVYELSKKLRSPSKTD